MKLSHDEAVIACEAYSSILKVAFPGFLINIHVTRIIGDIIIINVANVPSASDAPMGIIHNATVHMRGLIHASPKGCYMENPIMSGRGLKFRKISGANEGEVLKKFVIWMEKNADAIKAIVPQFRT